MATDEKEIIEITNYLYDEAKAGTLIEGDIDLLDTELREYFRVREELPKAAKAKLLELHDVLLKQHNSRLLEHYPELKHYLENTLDASYSEHHTEETIPSIDLSQNDKVVFLLGAGASAASGIPLVTGLLDELVKQARRTQDDEFNLLMKHCQKEEKIDIEDLLTAVYLSEFAVSEPNTLGLLHYFLFSDDSEVTSKEGLANDPPETDATSVNFIRDTIQTLFGSIASEMIPKDPNETHKEIKRFINDHKDVSIITTNYDYCMDEELFGEVEVDTTLNEVTTGEHEVSVELYKMHGSINWTYCDTCQSIDGVHPEDVKAKFEPDSGTLDYPVIGICPVCKGQRRPLLVPPTSFKFVQFPPLIDIREGAKRRLENADYIIPVGYSFSDADAYIYKLVWGAIRKNDAKMLIVDPKAKNEVAAELRSRFKARLDGFDGNRVVPINGKSEDVMSDLVNEMLDYDVRDGETSDQEKSAS